MTQISTAIIDTPRRCVCLDAEFVDGDELIELSIFALDRRPVYHSLFHPVRHKKWDSSIHHITPDMVADAPTFASQLAEVQAIVDAADHVMGFAVENDIGHLRRQGVERLDDKHVIELRDWFWINHGLQRDIDLFQGVSLASVAEELGIDFGDEGMHSASGDTLATLDSFLLLYDRFTASRADAAAAAADFDAVVKLFDEEYGREKLKYDRNHAEGYAVLMRAGLDGYAMRIRRDEPRRSSRIVAVTRVADRQKASIELHNMMARRPELERGVYRLTEKDVEAFRNYTNGFDADDHDYFKKLQNLSSRFNITGLKRR